MLVRNRGIFLHLVKYSDKSLIVKVLTETEGVQSYFVHGIRGKKNKSQGVLQPLNLIELVSWKEPGKELGTVREMRVEFPYQNIGRDFMKNSVVLFVNEVLYKVFRESGPQDESYELIREWLVDFDRTEFNPNKHLLLLAHLTAQLGFLPEVNYSPDRKYFDMIEGHFKDYFPNHPNVLQQPVSEAFANLFYTEPDSQLISSNRRELLTAILDYYRFHVEGFSEIKSLAVMRELMK